MTLLMATRAPELWAAASAWVPITDIATWHGETKHAGRRYWKMIEACCGGPPSKSPIIDAEYTKRSPLFHLEKAKGMPIDINAGVRDGHTGSVPISHSLRAFNRLAAPTDRIKPADIALMVREARVPARLAVNKLQEYDAAYGKKRPLFRRVSGNKRVTIFDGGHEVIPRAALEWLSRQRRP